jgi:hypothetical protein
MLFKNERKEQTGNLKVNYTTGENQGPNGRVTSITNDVREGKKHSRKGREGLIKNLEAINNWYLGTHRRRGAKIREDPYCASLKGKSQMLRQAEVGGDKVPPPAKEGTDGGGLTVGLLVAGTGTRTAELLGLVPKVEEGIYRNMFNFSKFGEKNFSSKRERHHIRKYSSTVFKK